ARAAADLAQALLRAHPRLFAGAGEALGLALRSDVHDEDMPGADLFRLLRDELVLALHPRVFLGVAGGRGRLQTAADPAGGGGERAARAAAERGERERARESDPSGPMSHRAASLPRERRP